MRFTYIARQVALCRRNHGGLSLIMPRATVASAFLLGEIRCFYSTSQLHLYRRKASSSISPSLPSSSTARARKYSVATRKKIANGDDENPEDMDGTHPNASGTLDPAAAYQPVPMDVTTAEKKDAYISALFPRTAMKERHITEMGKLVPLDKLEDVSKVLDDPQLLNYQLHTMREIPSSIGQALKAHKMMFVFSPMEDDAAMRRTMEDLENAFDGLVRGNALYVRIVDICDLKANSSPSGDGRDDGRQEGTARSLSGRRLSAKQQEALSKIQKIIDEYARSTISPFPGELACDISQYCTLAPLVHASQRHVAQVVRDVNRILEGHPIEKNGCPASPPKHLLEPMTPDKVATEVATRIRNVLFSGSFADTSADLRVCIGIAPFPVLAKIACDAEVALLRKLLCTTSSSCPSSSSSARRMDSAAPRRNSAEIQKLVRVRSFLAHMRNCEDTKTFLRQYRVANISVFPAAFAKLLQEVFGIVTCDDIYKSRDLLWFSLSKETFRACYAAVFGCSRFPQESHTLLFSPHNLERRHTLLESMATNAISAVNPSRTAIGGNMLLLTSKRRGVQNLGMTDAQLAYGRLMSDHQFIEVVRKVSTKLHSRICGRGLTTALLRVDLRRGYHSAWYTTQVIPATNDYREIMAIVDMMARKAAPHRQKAGVEKSGGIFIVHVVFGHLELASMTPVRLEVEIDRLTQECVDARHKLLKFNKESFKVQRENSPLASKRKKMVPEKARQKCANHEGKKAATRTGASQTQTQDYEEEEGDMHLKNGGAGGKRDKY